jgi:hypothetical protein
LLHVVQVHWRWLLEGGLHGRRGGEGHHSRGWGFGEDAVGLGLRGEHALGWVAVALALAVLFVGVLHADGAVEQGLAVHVCDGVVGGVEGGVGEEGVPL